MIERLAIPDVWTFTPVRHPDERGWFAETFNMAALSEALAGVSFVQDNQSLSLSAGTLRGMHFQRPPKGQAKLVRVVRGSVLDVAVDIRNGSPTFGRWVSAQLSAENGKQIFVPIGFAHGFLTLESDTEVLYKVSAFYSGAENQLGISWDDPDLGINWGMDHDVIKLKQGDRCFPRLADLESHFRFEQMRVTS